MTKRQRFFFEKESVFMDKMNYTAFNIIYDNWFKIMNWQKLLIQREIAGKCFAMECLLGRENTLVIRTRQTIYYIINDRHKLKFAKATDVKVIKQHGKIFPNENVLQVEKIIFNIRVVEFQAKMVI